MRSPAARGESGSRLSRGATARRSVGWRLGAFVGVFLLLLLGLDLLVLWVGGGPVTEPVLTFPVAAAFALAALAASAWIMERVEGVPLAALGLAVGPGQLGRGGRGFLVGAGIMSVAVGVLVLGGWLSWRPAPGGVAEAGIEALGLTGTLLLAAFAEELLFRGYPLQLLAARWGPGVAIGGTSLAFAAVHLANPGVNVLGVVNLVLAGLVLAVAWWRTYSLWFVVGLHLGWNWVMSVAVDLPVSGLTFDLPGFDPVLRGPGIWTGGAFGPEGGLAVTLAALVALGWLGRSRRLSRDPVTLALGPPCDHRLPGRSGFERRDEE